ncbi:hypothetical protein BGZ74_003602, partial [Mortierella antarctica]
MATTTAAERCLAIPEMFNKVISFRNIKYQINCARISPSWHVIPSLHSLAAESDLWCVLYTRRSGSVAKLVWRKTVSEW